MVINMCDSLKCDKCNSISYKLYPIDNGLYICKRCKDKLENEKEEKIKNYMNYTYCNYYDNDCFKCAYKLTDKQGLWCRVQGKYVKNFK